MTARKNSTQARTQQDTFNAAYDADKNAVSIRVLSNGLIAMGDGTPVTYAEAHKLITNARTEQREARKAATLAKRGETTATKRKKLEARAAGIAAALAALGADPDTVSA